MTLRPLEEIYNEIKKKLNFPDHEFTIFLEKLHSFGSFTDREWEAFELLKKEYDIKSNIIGVNFFVKTLSFFKYKGIAYPISNEIYNKFALQHIRRYNATTPRRYYEAYPHEEKTHEEKKKTHTKGLIIFCGLYSILIITLTISLWSLMR